MSTLLTVAVCLLCYCSSRSAFLTPVTYTGDRPDKNGLHKDKGKPCLPQTRQNSNLTWAWWIFMTRSFWIMHPSLNRLHNLLKEVPQQWGGGNTQRVKLHQHFLHQRLMFEILTSAHLDRWVTVLSGYHFENVHTTGDQTPLCVDILNRMHSNIMRT
jgi:hypothetical protein